jgi:lipopolysaccharide/colanic/teichoic acid biosynthesis glycosyltransferase
VLGLTILAPALAAIALVVRATSPGGVIYSQVRIGRNNVPFRMHKFRTMAADAEERLAEVLHLNLHAGERADERLYKIADDPRVTRFGAVLRRYSLDELPQLVNVLKGEMSLVGPRPLTPSEDAHVPASARIRSSVRPGITGLWQVLGRNELTFEEMMHLDVLYVTRPSLRRDVALVARTFPVVLRGQRSC